jgi:hypothetical protein
MNVETYLKNNIKPEVLQKAIEFKKSLEYKSILKYSNSEKYKAAKMQLKIRDRIVHKDILSKIEYLQVKK